MRTLKTYLYRTRTLFCTPGKWHVLVEMEDEKDIPTDFFQTRQIGPITWMEYQCITDNRQFSSISPAQIWETRVFVGVVSAVTTVAIFYAHSRFWG